MNISGFVKNSLIDYPGKIASVIFTQGCNMRCKFCQNYQLLPSGKADSLFFGEQEIFSYLESRAGFLDALVISGGEPTLQPDLEEFVKRVKSMGLMVKLDTNGTHPQLLKRLIDQDLIDYVAMDIKAPLDLSSYRDLVGDNFSEPMMDRVLESVSILMSSNIVYEFRTTLIRQCHSTESINIMCKQLKGASNYTLQQFSPDNVLDDAFSHLNSYSIDELEQIGDDNSSLISHIRAV